MDKTIEIILVATVVLATAAIVLFLTNSQATDFGTFLGNQSDSANCGIWETEYKNQACEGGTSQPISDVFSSDKADKINNKCDSPNWESEVSC